jgi:3-dehydroquinate synthase/shikimate kinase/3-dehydroquinate synthase
MTALNFSLNEKLIKKKEHQTIINHIYKMKLPSNIKNYFSVRNLNTILTFMIKDKKNFSKKINLILLKKVGSTIISNQYDISKIKKFLKKELIN